MVGYSAVKPELIISEKKSGEMKSRLADGPTYKAMTYWLRLHERNVELAKRIS